MVFNQLLVERRVSKVAENLGLSQPAVSNALARLRKLHRRRAVPAHAQGHGADAVRGAAGRAGRDALGDDPQRDQPADVSFDPATATRAFTVGMTDIGEIYFLPDADGGAGAAWRPA